MKIAFALIFVAATASAKSFLIERIDVNAAKRIPVAAVIAETRLDAGKTYDEAQLDQAVNRVRRMPFVLYASYDLKPGSTPDARVLRIDVEEAANFNWNFDVDARGRRNFGGGSTFGGSAGYRFFPTRSGTLDAFVAENNESFLPGAATVRTATVAYNGWGLFGTRAYGSVGVGTVFRTNSQHDVNPSLLLGLPLTSVQSIELTASRTTTRLERSVDGLVDPVRSFYRSTDAGLTWRLQTTDDPFFARSGFDVSAGPAWQHVDLDIPFVLTSPKPPHIIADQQKQRFLVLNANAAKYWPIREASAAWTRFEGFSKGVADVANGRTLPTSRWNSGDLLLGLAHDYNHELGGEEQFRWRLESGIGYHYEKIKQETTRDGSGPEIEIGTVYRGRFALVHISLSYVGH